ncbi:hypothetical protein HMN09_00575000 [Mycena chlorophos]|uniref:DUF1793-domain-containing protein n=1 Tax=Mycena chlorophos TaxID=658473 RepID=A0A8H6TCM2_MYCCL|nr:hypothetical protein HMN09_00575000 [Mycena chlorophos]
MPAAAPFLSRRNGIPLPLPLLSLLLLFLANAAPVAQAAQTFFPPAVPLAVRSPVFNTWVDTRAGQTPVATWPTFWNDQKARSITGWAGYARVDQVAYHIWGSPTPGTAGTWLGTEITPTRTIFNVQAGAMNLTVTFLSPIEPDDPVKQSFPGAYVYVEGSSTDGRAHNVQLYADISGEWVSQSFSTAITWSTGKTTNAAYHQVQPSTPSSTFTDMPEDAIAWHAVPVNAAGRQSIVADDVSIRPQIAANTTGALTLTSDLTGTTGVVDNNGKFPVFAHYIDLGSVSSVTTGQAAWAVGVQRDPITTFQGVARHSYWWSEYGTLAAGIDAFMADAPAALTRAIALDNSILAAANAVSDEYADVVSLGLRQALAGVELTVSPSGKTGGFNTSDVLAFMKDTGNSQRVNPTEGIYALMPALVYLNASLIGPLIEPLLRFQVASAAGYNYALPDLGSPYPSVPGNTVNNVAVGVEHSGNMLALALAHARGTGDGTILGQYYPLFQTYASFLANNTFSAAQQTADSREAALAQTGANITNLGVKGIVGMRAMVQIADAVGDRAGAQAYAALAANMTTTWTARTLFSAGASTGLAWVYQDGSSEGLMYNLYADRLLGLGAFPDSVYQAEANGYTTSNTYGVALSSDSNLMARSDWTLFTAAALSSVSSSTRDTLISGVHARASSNATATNGTFANLYNVQTGRGVAQGVSPNGFGTPAQGAMMSVLALSTTNKTISVPASLTHSSSGDSSSSGSSKSGSNVGAIAGGIIGGLIFLAVLGLLAWVAIRRRREYEANTEANNSMVDMSVGMGGGGGGSVVGSQAASQGYSNWRPPPSMPSVAATHVSNASVPTNGTSASAYSSYSAYPVQEQVPYQPYQPPYQQQPYQPYRDEYPPQPQYQQPQPYQQQQQHVSELAYDNDRPLSPPAMSTVASSVTSSSGQNHGVGAGVVGYSSGAGLSEKQRLALAYNERDTPANSSTNLLIPTTTRYDAGPVPVLGPDDSASMHSRTRRRNVLSTSTDAMGSSLSGASSGGGSRSQTEELRTELATLRREMEALRAQTEAPPTYQSVS